MAMTGAGTGAQPTPHKRRRTPPVPAGDVPCSRTVRSAGSPVARSRATSNQATVLPRTTHRLLMMRGLDTAEAANLTAFINGIPVDHCTWSLREINRLLFLRSVARKKGWDH
jgi:hypothetical protein